MNCTRCDGTGFLNLFQVDTETLNKFDETGDINVILDWIIDRDEIAKQPCTCSDLSVFDNAISCSSCLAQHNVQICDCCGDSYGWFNTPGQHEVHDHAWHCA